MAFADLPLDPYLPADQQDIDDLPDDGWTEEAVTEAAQQELSQEDYDRS